MQSHSLTFFIASPTQTYLFEAYRHFTALLHDKDAQALATHWESNIFLQQLISGKPVLANAPSAENPEQIQLPHDQVKLLLYQVELIAPALGHEMRRLNLDLTLSLTQLMVYVNKFFENLITFPQQLETFWAGLDDEIQSFLSGNALTILINNEFSKVCLADDVVQFCFAEAEKILPVKKELLQFNPTFTINSVLSLPWRITHFDQACESKDVTVIRKLWEYDPYLQFFNSRTLSFIVIDPTTFKLLHLYRKKESVDKLLAIFKELNLSDIIAKIEYPELHFERAYKSPNLFNPRACA